MGPLGERAAAAAADFRRAPAHLAGDMIALGLATAVFRTLDPQGVWWIGLLATLPLWTLRLVAVALQGLNHRRGTTGLLRWHRRHTALVVSLGPAMGITVAVFQPLASGFQQSTLLTAVFVCTLAAVPALALRPVLQAAHAGLTLGPLAFVIAMDHHDPEHLNLLAMVVIMSSLVFWIGSSFRSTVQRLALLKDRAHALRRELEEQAVAARQAQWRAEAADRGKTQWIAATSHDLRQPVMALQLFSEHLKTRLCRVQDGWLLQGVQHSLQALQQMSGDLLEVARMEAGVRPVRLQPVCMGAVFDRLAAQLAPTAFDRGLLLRWRGGHHVITADPQWLERCLRNLVVNALNHTEDGGIIVAARRHGATIRLQVWDSGPGVAAEWQPQLFEEYVQVPPEGVTTHAWAERGCGLGLSIVRRLAHLMGGQVFLRSRPGRGSVFELRLPVTVGEPGPEPEPGPGPGPGPHGLQVG